MTESLTVLSSPLLSHSLCSPAAHSCVAVLLCLCVVSVHTAACLLYLVSSGHLLRHVSCIAYSVRPSLNTPHKEINHFLLSLFTPAHLADGTVAVCLPVCLFCCTVNSLGAKPVFFRFYLYFLPESLEHRDTDQSLLNALEFAKFHKQRTPRQDKSSRSGYL